MKSNEPYRHVTVSISNHIGVDYVHIFSEDISIFSNADLSMSHLTPLFMGIWGLASFGIFSEIREFYKLPDGARNSFRVSVNGLHFRYNDKVTANGLDDTLILLSEYWIGYLEEGLANVSQKIRRIALQTYVFGEWRKSQSTAPQNIF